MRLIFLGTGTSSGVPVIACDCAVCTSADPRDRRLRCGAAVLFTDPQGRERVILIDATPDLRQQALLHNLRRCDAILFTHNHVDHTFGLDEVRRFNAVQHAPIEIFAETHTLEHLRRIYAHIFERERNVNDSFVASIIARTVEPGRPVELFGLKITPIRLLHGKLPILGYRFERAGHATDAAKTQSAHSPTASSAAGMNEHGAGGEGVAGWWKDDAPQQPVVREGQGIEGNGQGNERGLVQPPILAAADADALSPADLKPPHTHTPPAPLLPLAWCTDVSAIPPESWPLLKGLNVLVLDALRYRRHPTHFCFNQAIEVAEQTRARRTFFIHMTHDIAHADAEAALPPQIRLAYDGLTLTHEEAVEAKL